MIRTKVKKITLPVLASIISFQISTLFLLGVIAGYVLTYFVVGRVKSRKLALGSYRIHMHHWVFSSIVLAIIFFSGISNFIPVFLLGMGGGNIFHGIYSYGDWHRVVYRV